MNILEKIDNYNKIKNIEINKKLNIKKKNYTINFDKKDNIIIEEKGEKKIIGKYIYFGIYQPENKLWIWSSSIPGVNQKQIKLIKEIKNKNYLFENEDNKDITFIYQLLSNDIIQLSNIKKFKLINKILNFFSDSIIIFNITNKIGNIQFIGLQNIIEEYL
jgi:hypothetical protein